MKKRGINSVVATVLVILISVAAVTIIWTSVIPMLKEETFFEEGLLDLSIITFEGYTVWDEITHSMSVQVKRGNDDTNLVGVQFIFTKNGSSVIYISYEIPDKNQKKIYNFYLGNVFGGEPDSVSIAPIFRDGNVEKIGTIISSVKDVSVPEGKVNQEELIVVGIKYICSSVYTTDYCNQFDGAYSNKASCENAGCSATEIKYCNWADINQDGEVNGIDYEIFEIDYNNGRTGCSSEIMPGDVRAWCNGSDINQDGDVDFIDYSIFQGNYPRTGCNLEETWTINCYSTSVCDGNTESSCESKAGCSWIPVSFNCSNPIMQAVWNSTSGILADGAFDTSEYSSYLSVVLIGEEYVLKVIPGKDSTCSDSYQHCYEKVVKKNLGNLQSWGGTIYINLKDLIPPTLIFAPPDMVFLGGYSDTSTMRNLGIAAFRSDDINQIYMKGYYYNVSSGSKEGQRLLVGESSDGWPDRFIRIDWFFTLNYELFGRVDEGEWKRISPLGDNKNNFTQFWVGWVSSYSGGSAYIKNVTLYPESCVPGWMTA